MGELPANILYECKLRGVTPAISCQYPQQDSAACWTTGTSGKVSYRGGRVLAGTDEWGQVKTRTTTTASGAAIGTLLDWSSTDTKRNVHQRILDGDYDTWIDQMAQALERNIMLEEDPDVPGPGPKKTLKNTDWDQETNIIFRLGLELNATIFKTSPRYHEAVVTDSEIPNLSQMNAGDADDAERAYRYRARDEWQHAWVRFFDRIRRHNGASNVQPFACFVNVSDTGLVNDKSFRHNIANYTRPGRDAEVQGKTVTHHGSDTDFSLDSRTMRDHIGFIGFDLYDWHGVANRRFDKLSGNAINQNRWRASLTPRILDENLRRAFNSLTQVRPMLTRCLSERWRRAIEIATMTHPGGRGHGTSATAIRAASTTRTRARRSNSMARTSDMRRRVPNGISEHGSRGVGTTTTALADGGSTRRRGVLDVVPRYIGDSLRRPACRLSRSFGVRPPMPR